MRVFHLRADGRLGYDLRAVGEHRATVGNDLSVTSNLLSADEPRVVLPTSLEEPGAGTNVFRYMRFVSSGRVTYSVLASIYPGE